MNNIITPFAEKLTVGDLKKALESIPDDMFVVIPVVSIDNTDQIFAFNYAKTMGILNDPDCKESDNRKRVLCINSCEAGSNISKQIRLSGKTVICDKIIY